MRRGPAMFFGAIVAFGLGPAVWVGGTFATAEADEPDTVPRPVPSVSVSTLYVAVEPTGVPQFADVSDIADPWVPPSPTPSTASPSAPSATPSRTPPVRTSPLTTPGPPKTTPPAPSSPPPAEPTPEPSESAQVSESPVAQA